VKEHFGCESDVYRVTLWFVVYFGLITCSQYLSGTGGTLPEDLNPALSHLYSDL